MADAPRLLSVGQYVKNEGRLCMIQEIKNHLGFNQYFIVDMDSGVCLKRARYQIEPIELKGLPGADDSEDFDDDNADSETANEEKNTSAPAKRFLSVSSEELDSIEINRTSYRTRKQTIWAVNILKGEFVVMAL